jgi:hypothetical protein
VPPSINAPTKTINDICCLFIVILPLILISTYFSIPTRVVGNYKSTAAKGGLLLFTLSSPQKRNSGNQQPQPKNDFDDAAQDVKPFGIIPAETARYTFAAKQEYDEKPDSDPQQFFYYVHTF